MNPARRTGSFSVPGKTFLVGEYLALDGGPSLVLSTEPRFTLSVTKANQEAAVLEGIHADSPAGKFVRSLHTDADTSNFVWKFSDPHDGQGGLGASTAQFALCYAALRGWDRNSTIPWQELLKDYRSFAWTGEGVPPSGADLVAQLTGGVTYFDGRSFEVKKFDWAFEDLGFSLLRTGTKLATHEHLKKKIAAPFKELRTIVREALRAFETGESMRLIEAVNAYSHLLRQADLTSEATLDLLDRVRSRTDLIWAAKGCGAMGADIVLCLHDSKRTGDVKDFAKAEGLEVCGTDFDLASGGLR